MTTNINIEEIQNKLYESLKPSGWADKLKTFILSDDFTKILQSLVKDVDSGNRFVPQLKYLFNAFIKCPYDDLKVVLIGQDPYPYLGIPDGLAFSCSLQDRTEASLKYMFKEIERTVYDSTSYRGSPDLTRWSNQGILLLNSSLTTIVGRPGLHALLWRPFMAYLFDHLGWYKSGLIYLFMGRVAQKWAESLPDNSYKVFVSHPASAAHSRLDNWDSNNCFVKVNELLVENKSEPIIW